MSEYGENKNIVIPNHHKITQQHNEYSTYSHHWPFHSHPLMTTKESLHS